MTNPCQQDTFAPQEKSGPISFFLRHLGRRVHFAFVELTEKFLKAWEWSFSWDTHFVLLPNQLIFHKGLSDFQTVAGAATH